MKIFAHRANDIEGEFCSLAYGAEIDVHINTMGNVVVRHNPDEPGWILRYFLEKSPYKKFFVDIKQNLDVKYLKRIVEQFGDRLYSIFDVPYPSVFYAKQAGIELHDRLSEYESRRPSSNKFWLDPLMAGTPWKYQMLLSKTNIDDEVIICSPELHGHSTVTIQNCWGWIKDRLDDNDSRVCGLVTKLPNDAAEYFKDYL